MARTLSPRTKASVPVVPVGEYYDEDEDFDDDDEAVIPEGDEDEEPTEEELLAQYPDDVVASARRKSKAIENGYSVAEIANFLNWKSELVEAIEGGVFDGVDLRDIVAACFARRAEVLKDRPPVKMTTLVPAGVLGEDGGKLRPAPHAPRRFQYEGAFYSKDDMEGRYVRTSTDGGRWYQRGLLAKIVSVGNAYLVVEWVDDPQAMYPTSTELSKKGIKAGSEGKVSADSVAHIFA